jgi:hypothetical protein
MKVNKRSIYAIGLAVTCLGFASTGESAKAQLSKFSGINTDNTMNPETMKNITHLMSRQTSVQISVDANSVSGIAAGGTYRIAGDNLATATLPTITAAGLVNGTGRGTTNATGLAGANWEYSVQTQQADVVNTAQLVSAGLGIGTFFDQNAFLAQANNLNAVTNLGQAAITSSGGSFTAAANTLTGNNVLFHTSITTANGASGDIIYNADGSVKSGLTGTLLRRVAQSGNNTTQFDNRQYENVTGSGLFTPASLKLLPGTGGGAGVGGQDLTVRVSEPLRGAGSTTDPYCSNANGCSTRETRYSTNENGSATVLNTVGVLQNGTLGQALVAVPADPACGLGACSQTTETGQNSSVMNFTSTAVTPAGYANQVTSTGGISAGAVTTANIFKAETAAGGANTTRTTCTRTSFFCGGTAIPTAAPSGGPNTTQHTFTTRLLTAADTVVAPFRLEVKTGKIVDF